MTVLRFRLVSLFAAAAIAFASAQVSAPDTIVSDKDGSHVAISNDKITIIDGDDTVSIYGGSGGLGSLIKNLLDDTVITRNDYYDADYQRNLTMRHEADSVRDQVKWIVLFLIAIGGMLVYYFNRRAHYRMIEKAIENNYRLPADVLGSTMPPGVQSPQQPPVLMPNMTAPPIGTPPPLPISQWPRYDGAIKLIAIGLGAMLFFFVVDSSAMVALSSIVLLLGLGKAFLVYQQQRDIQLWNRNSNQQQ